MGLTGNLKTMSIAEVLEWLSMSRKTGTLVVNGPRFSKRLNLINGELVAISSDNPREMIGRYLVGSGYLGPDELEYLVEMQQHFQLAMGELAVKLGQITRDDMDRLLRIKTEESLRDLLTWEEGDFRFVEGELPSRDLLKVHLQVRGFLLEGMRQNDELNRMREAVPDVYHVPRLIRFPEDEHLDPDEQEILRYIDGARTIESIALRAQVTEFKAMATVFRGVRQGWIEVGPPPPREELETPYAHLAWRELADKIQEDLDRGRLLDALLGVLSLREKYGDDPVAVDFAFDVEGRLEQAVKDTELEDGAVLEPTISPQELMKLDIDPGEGFVLSRLNGRYSIGEILSQLPGNELHNLVRIHELHRRGLVKVSKVHSVRKYQEPGEEPPPGGGTPPR